MAQSITHYVDVTVSLEADPIGVAGFGVPGFLFESTVETGSRVHGPFSTDAAGEDLIDFGYTAGSPPVLFAEAMASQQPHARTFVILRGDAGDADISDSLDAAYAESPAAWYATLMDSRDAADIELLAAWTETRRKIALSQSNDASLLTGTGRTYTATIGGTPADGNYQLIFTGFGLGAPVTVTTARTAGTPATNALLGPAMETELVTVAGTTLNAVLVDASIDAVGAVVSFALIDGLPTGTITTAQPVGATITVAPVDADIGSVLFGAQYTRHALLYHPTDADRLDAAWAARCLSADLDVRKLIWVYKRLPGFTGASLTDAQIAALQAVNVNYFSPATMSSGRDIAAFTAQGWTSSGAADAGRRIDITTSIDWLQARLEESLTNTLMRETHGIGFDNSGINRFGAASREVVSGRGVSAGHLIPFQVPEGQDQEGLKTPYVRMPTYREVVASDRTARTLRFQAIGYLREAIERVVFNVEVRR